MGKKIEQKTADTILNLPDSEIIVGGHSFQLTAPTPATLIMVSALVADVPIVSNRASNVIHEMLLAAKDMHVVGKIAATLILGAKRINEHNLMVQITTKTEYKWSWKRFKKVKRTVTHRKLMPEIDYVATTILNEFTTQELSKLIGARLAKMQIGDFFELTAFLSGANLLKRTREAETQSGA